MNEQLSPERVIPRPLAEAVSDLPIWFVIGGQAIRCLCPYRPSRDVDFGVITAVGFAQLVAQLERTGKLEISERSSSTAHLRWNGIDVSIFKLPFLKPYVTDRRIDITAILGTKLHAILDRGTRRDFFDLYVMLQHHQLGIVACLQAIRQVYAMDVNESLMLRALTFFDDADRETKLPGEGANDWTAVKDYFLTTVGSLLVPPRPKLAIQRRRVDITEPATPKRRRKRASGARGGRSWHPRRARAASDTRTRAAVA